MDKPQLTFERRELKYMLDDAQRAGFESLCEGRMVPDEHGPSTVRNVYYDTPSFLLARRSSEHPVYKEKLRMRCYGEPSGDVFAELKKKYDGVVYKRRVTLPLRDAEELFAGRLVPEGQIGREVAASVARYDGLAPMAYLAYDRVALYAVGDRGLRMTLDRDVRARWDDVRLDGADEGGRVLGEGLSILEVKASAGLPLWVVRALESVGAERAHWSKYGTACAMRLDGAAVDGRGIVAARGPAGFRLVPSPVCGGYAGVMAVGA